MKKLSTLILIIFISSCASGPRISYESTQTYRPDGIYGGWKTQNNSNEFDQWVVSRAEGEKHNWAENVPFIHVENDSYIGFNIGDGYMCEMGYFTDMSWSKPGVDSYISQEVLYVSKDRKMLYLQKEPIVGRGNLDRLLYMLNFYDKLALKTSDSCGENRITRYNIKGTHHITTKQTWGDGLSNVINVETIKK